MSSIIECLAYHKIWWAYSFWRNTPSLWLRPIRGNLDATLRNKKENRVIKRKVGNNWYWERPLFCLWAIEPSVLLDHHHHQWIIIINTVINTTIGSPIKHNRQHWITIITTGAIGRHLLTLAILTAIKRIAIDAIFVANLKKSFTLDDEPFMFAFRAW